MSIIFNNESSHTVDFDHSKFDRLIKIALRRHKRLLGELNYIFCDDNYLLNVNREFLQHYYLTDIITFNYCEGRTVSGDVFISLDRVKENSLLFSCAYIDEIVRVVMHGVLHLLGYDDHTEVDRANMRGMENYYISKYHSL